MVRCEWSKFTEEDFKRYYEEHFNGMSIGEVEKRDQRFYSALWNRGLIDEVLPIRKRKKRIKWSNFSEKDLKKYYEKNYLEKTRTEIRKKDPLFYRELRRRNLIEDILPPTRRAMIENMSLEELKEYYKEKHSGRTKSRVQNKDVIFYTILKKRGLLSEVISSNIREKRNWKGFSREDFERYYEENFKGMGRTEVAHKDWGFYKALIKKGLLQEILPPKQISKYSSFESEDFKRYYKEFQEKGLVKKII